MLQIGDKNQQFVIDCRQIDCSPLFPYIESIDFQKIGTNLKFEYKMFLGNWGIRMQNMKDIMIQEMILVCGLQHSGFGLQNLVKKYLNIYLPKGTRLEFTKIGDKQFKRRHIKYGADDIIYPVLINEFQEKQILNDNLQICQKLENNFIRILGEMEFNGMLVNTNKWLSIYKENKKLMIETLNQLDSFLIEKKARPFIGTINMFTNRPTISINWGSDRQVVDVFKYFKIPTKILDKEKSKKYSKLLGQDVEIFKDTVGAAEISQYENKYPLVKLYLKYKKLEKSVDSFGEEWVNKFVNKETSRVHTSFWQILNTGRISSRNPNIQQIKRGTLRTCFPASEGRKLIVRDYSNQEGRLIADMAQEEAMIEEFLNGSGDLHSLTGSRVFSLVRGENVVVSKTENADLRFIAKMVNFGSLYGIGAYKLAKNLQIKVELAEEIIKGYYKTYPSLTKYFKKGHKFATEKGYVLIDNFTKRRSYFSFFNNYLKTKSIVEDYKERQYEAKREGSFLKPLDKSVWSDFFTLKGTMERASQNYRIQGGSASMTKLALIFLYDYIYKNKLFDKVSLILALHDEIVLEVEEKLASHIDLKLKEFMSDAGSYFAKIIPMESDGGVCDLWEH
jgi:DNA polymerase-1